MEIRRQMTAEEFLSNKGIYHNVTYKTEDGKFTLTELLQLYADEQKKKEAKDFAHWIVMNQDKIKLGQTYVDFYGELYNEWKSNQEDKG